MSLLLLYNNDDDDDDEDDDTNNDDDDDDDDDDGNDNNNAFFFLSHCNAQIEIFTIASLRHELSPACTLKWPGRNCVQKKKGSSTSSAYHV